LERLWTRTSNWRLWKKLDSQIFTLSRFNALWFYIQFMERENLIWKWKQIFG